MEYSTIKDLLFAYILQNNGDINFENVTDIILKQFPNSEWKKTHWAWYKTQIVSPNGKYYQLFPEDIRKNISQRSHFYHNKSHSPNIVKKTQEKEEFHIFENESDSVKKQSLCV